MGRRSDLPFDFKSALQIRHVPLDGGYDPGGAYWGGPDNLYCVVSEDGRERYLRAAGFDEVKAQFPNATFPPQSSISDSDIDDMLAGYIEAALFSTNDESTPEGGEPLDNNYNESDLTPKCRAGMREDCAKFARENSKALLASMGKKGRSTVKWASWDLAGLPLLARSKLARDRILGRRVARAVRQGARRRLQRKPRIRRGLPLRHR